MPTPFFSIIVPTYNRARLLDRALESVLAQHESSWELLVADDGSTDGTWAALCDWTRRDDRVRCWRHANRGQAATRNALLERARGNWVAFLDSDDELLPDHLALRRKAITELPATQLWLAPMRIVGNPLVPCCVHPGEMIHIDHCLGVGMLTIRREAILQAGGFPEIGYAEDSALMRRLLASGMRIGRLTQRSYVYHRSHVDSVTSNQVAANDIIKAAHLAESRLRPTGNLHRNAGAGIGMA
ncbi:glycosyltransferase family A protein [Rhodanobacter sp. AS-Z3]|uniref:glycosyltransferase family 2 protein n=1 Tax=Rhodanobacter sp. AS-Z3 TaxID=3031330 RepID=UPI00247AC098|nr:glycosyltransferase family A protein [Rhodanobacter sp. AS-Z3]WEN14244.1 glycosyltransferase family A protein [Rhodanobacter sp. AS-Z3]